MKQYRTAIVTGFLALFLSLNMSLAVADESEQVLDKRSGPIGIRNQMPLYLFYLQMVPDVAGVTERNKFKVNADYTVSNITVSAFTPKTSLYDIQIDLEVNRITLDLRYGLYDNLEIGLEVPYISLSSGYLDNVIETVEDGIGARTPRSRKRQGTNEFDYRFKYNGNFLINQRQSTEGLGDIVLTAKYQLLKDKGWFWPNLSARSAIKFPTAEKDDLLGSGEFDYGFGLLMDKGFFNRAFLYIGANIIMIEKPSFFSVLGLKDEIFSGLLALEYFFTQRFSLVTQVTANSTPYPFSDTNPLDNEGYEWGLGLNYRLKEKKDISWHFAITENISAASSPDASVHTGINWKF